MANETEILTALMDAAFGADDAADLWPAFLDRLANATRAESTALHVLPRGGAPRLWRAGAPWPGPEPAAVARMRTGRVYSQVDLPGPGAAPRPLRALRWRTAEGGVALVALQREGGDFRALDGVTLANLAPFLGPALDGWHRLDRRRARARLDAEVCRGLGAGWILFAPSGEPLEMSPGLPERLEAVAGLRRRADNRLSLPNPGIEHALRQAVAAVLPHGPPQRATLARHPPVEIALSAIRLGGERLVIGRLRHGLSARALPPGRVAEWFGLGRSEARLAVRLCDGFTLREAAEDLGWTIETARSYSKLVYARMGVAGQPGVVRRILQSAIWLG